MDSDSSLDGEFESKHEVAARRNSAAAQSESGGEENDESDMSSTDSEDEHDGSAVPNRRESSPPSHSEDGSDTEGSKHPPSPTHFTPRSPSLDRENWPRVLDCGGPESLVVRNCSSGSGEGNLSPGSNSRKHSTSSEDRKLSPSSQDSKHAPFSKNGKCSPSSEYVKDTSASDKHFVSSKDGKFSPHSEDGKSSPHSEYGKSSPNSEEGKLSPHSENEKLSPRYEDEKLSPGSEDGKFFPHSEDMRISTHSKNGKLSPHSDEEKRSSHSNDGKLSTRSKGGRYSPISGGEKHTYSSGIGKHSPTLDAGNVSPSSHVGKPSPSSGTEKHTPSSFFSGLATKKRTLRSGTRRNSTNSGNEKLPSRSNTRKHSTSSGTGKLSPSSDTGKHSLSSDSSKPPRRLGTGKHSTNLGTRKPSTSSGTGKHSSSLGIGMHSFGSDTANELPSLDIGKHSPNFGTTGYSSPDCPRSPIFDDEHSLGSPVPRKCTPSSDHENQLPSFYGTKPFLGDKSPSTDYGNQSPSSGRGRWTPSPDRGTRSPKLKALELGEESVGSYSGIRSPSLNGDSRSSRGWSASPERDKHFRIASQEAQSTAASDAAIHSPVSVKDGDHMQTVSISESGMLVPNTDGEKQHPKLSCKEPLSTFVCELSPVAEHKNDSVISPRSHSPDSNNEEAPTSNKNMLTGGRASPNSNDDGELSDSSQDVSVQLKKVNRQADGEKEKRLSNVETDKVTKKSNITSHGEDLSDVSDLDINDGAESLGEVLDEHDKKSSKGAPPTEEVEQLDFEAEEREEGECEAREDGKSEDEGELKGDELEEGELTDDDENRPEETEPRPICRFYSRGQCTWGPNCRFLHPGVTDKGNYTMFDMVRPMVTINGPPIYPMEYRVPVPVPYEKPAPAVSYQGPRKEETPVFESAWERGLRQAKEMMRKSTKRKEMDMDFEEKKMNLSLGQEELDKENDYYTRQTSPIKEENERWSSYERLKVAEPDGKYVREGSVFEEYPSDHPYYHQHSRSEYWRRVQYEPGGGDSRTSGRVDSSDYRSSSKYRRSPSYYDKYDKKKKSSSSHSTREVIMQRVEKPWRDERYAEVTASSHRARGDEWADPWMRSKSPTGRKGTSSRPTRKSYSSGSSYSSSSSSRSSSRSSYSSYSRDSHSRSRSKSFSRSRSRSRSRSPASRRRKPNRPLVPTARAAMAAGEVASSPALRVGKLVPELRTLTKAKPTAAALLTASEKKAVTERAPLMNPPAPTPRKPKDARPPSPGMMRKMAQNPPAPSANAGKGVSGAKPALDRPKLTVAGAASIKAKMHSHSASSKSSSGSDSSGSSSDSSESSYSSSSSSREPSPKAVRPQKRMVIDERDRLAFAQSMKIKAMDALKLSGQKQQIKLTLKTPGSLGGSAAAGVTAVKKPGTGLPELPELNLVRRAERNAATLAGKKRPAEDMAVAEQAIAAKMAALSKPAVKKATSRREELLKQLKAVEDAIARKRSKIIP